MFWTFKLSLDEDILAFLDLAIVWATFSKIWVNCLSNLLVTLTPMLRALNAAGYTTHTHQNFLCIHQNCYRHILPLQSFN